MKRSFVSILVLLALLAGVFGSALPVFAGGANAYTDPVLNVNAGDIVTVAVKVNTDQPMTGWQFDLSWDPALLQWNSNNDFAAGSELTAWAQGIGLDTSLTKGKLDTTNAGHMIAGAMVTLGNTGGQGFTGTGTLATMKFKALANGKAKFSFDASKFKLVNPAGSVIPGATFAPTFIQVGPAPKLAVSAIQYSNPVSGDLTRFDAKVTVTNQSATSFAPDAVTPETMTWSINNATGGTPASPILLPAFAANESKDFNVTGFTLAAGQQTADFTAAIPAFGATKTGTYSAVASGGTTPVDASFGAFILITPPTQITFSGLQLGNTNTQTGTLNVKCNSTYQVDLSDNGSTAWSMTEFNPGTQVYGSKKLHNPLSVAAQSNIVTAGSSAKLVTGDVSTQNASNGADISMTFKQPLVYQDELLKSPEVYHLVLTYNGYVTILP
jgi:hypothetical protein